ncbi:MAG: hypothetical protein WCG93_08775 [Paludibacter sp.]
MKNIIFVLAVASIIVVGSIFTGFPSPAQKAEAAQIKLQEAKIGLDFAQTTADEVATKELKIETSKTEIWECELAIQTNNHDIVEINARMANDGSVLDELYSNRVNAMEMKNYQLQKRIAVIESEQSTWEQIKREFNKDADKFGKNLYGLVFEKRN